MDLCDSTARAGASEQLHDASHAHGILRVLDLSGGSRISGSSSVLLALTNGQAKGGASSL